MECAFRPTKTAINSSSRTGIQQLREALITPLWFWVWVWVGVWVWGGGSVPRSRNKNWSFSDSFCHSNLKKVGSEAPEVIRKYRAPANSTSNLQTHKISVERRKLIRLRKSFSKTTVLWVISSPLTRKEDFRILDNWGPRVKILINVCRFAASAFLTVPSSATTCVTGEYFIVLTRLKFAKEKV